jgi:hypothetical protein
LDSFATWSLVAISLAAGWLLGWGFLRLSDRKALAGATNRLRAHLMELRLFADEPALVWTAQWDLVKANGVFLWTMLKPLALLAMPAVLLMWQLEPFYARTPMRVGEVALLTMDADQPLTSQPVLQPAHAISVETGAVRWNENRSATWRLRASGAGVTPLPLAWDGGTMHAEVVSGDLFLRLPSSQSSGQARIAISYPERSFSLFGWPMGWSAWFLLWSSVAALAAVWWFR